MRRRFKTVLLSCFLLLLGAAVFAGDLSGECLFPDSSGQQAPEWVCAESDALTVGMGDSRAMAVFDALQQMVQDENVYMVQYGRSGPDDGKKEQSGEGQKRNESFWDIASRQSMNAQLLMDELQAADAATSSEEDIGETTQQHWKKRFGKNLVVQGWNSGFQGGKKSGFELRGEIFFQQKDCQIAMEQTMSASGIGSDPGQEGVESSWTTHKRNCSLGSFYSQLPVLGGELAGETVSGKGAVYVAIKRNENWPTRENVVGQP